MTTAPAFDILRADYLAAIGAERIPTQEHGSPCTHQPHHIIRVLDPRPSAKAGAVVRVLLDCAPLDALAR